MKVIWLMGASLAVGLGLCQAAAGEGAAQSADQAAAQEVIPYPRPVVKSERVAGWTFQTDAAGWRAAHDCVLDNAGGVLRIQSSGDDPYLIGPPVQMDGAVAARLRLKCAAGGNGQIFWMEGTMEGFDEAHSEHFHLWHDNQWHDYRVALAAQGTIRRLRLDPAEGPGVIEVEGLEAVRETLHPLEIESVHSDGARVSARLKNHGAETISFTLGGQACTLEAGASGEFFQIAPGDAPFRAFDLAVASTGLPPIHRLVSIIDAEAARPWAELRSGRLVVRAAREGTGARVELDGRPAAVLAPLVSREGVTPKLALTVQGNALLWRGEGVALKLSLRGEEITAKIASDRPCEGPVLRAFGPLEQGLFAGLEYLAKGEHSSSMLDIETEEHVRFAPEREKVTMPLMAFVTDRATTAMTWRDMRLQPVFATPNFLDGPEGHRASLLGTNIECAILVRPAGPMEEAILWAAQRRGLPPLPAAPRGREAELGLCLTALSGPPLKTAAGWGHCAEANWPRQPFADQASTVWRLTGQIPALPQLAPGGAHIVNDAIYFVTGRAGEWLKMRSAQAQEIMGEQKPDGSFRYAGQFGRGHFEDTASGYCAARAVELLEQARLTGDAAALQAGVKALEFMKHFRDPRGAQTWECPLHAPDILAAAHLVRAYVRGYQLTGQRDYLERARAWALTGLPFVYQWSEEPTMAYATIAIFGATGWRAPNWMGRPVQWCGYDYAYALTLLAPLDHTLDWKRLATGILTAAEQMQYPAGEFAGCEPDSFELAEQHRNGPAINPCALVSLRLVLEGKLDSLAVATGGGHRVAAPFPVSIRGGQARVQGRKGVAYQMVVDGGRIVEVQSRGEDSIPLNAK
ncbi:MAG TPA: hypothetical protein VN765_03690 [Candidatus Acidoferrum sp.]|nr:hypothetical protein [Candidatus Acidoferrum sp.]